jgi:Zn-dependent protease
MFFGLTAPVIISRLITLVIAFTGHEFAHAWSADELGDDTPRLNGRLTLNPLSHLDPLGSLLLLVAGFGWARPVPINPYALERRTPSGTMLVSIAGPLSNLVMAILAAIPFRAGWLDPFAGPGKFLPSASSFLTEFIFINLILLFFNLIPLSPLDGEKVLEYFLPAEARSTLYQLRPYGPLLLLALVFLAPLVGLDVLGTLIGWPTQQVFRLLVL